MSATIRGIGRPETATIALAAHPSAARTVARTGAALAGATLAAGMAALMTHVAGAGVFNDAIGVAVKVIANDPLSVGLKTAISTMTLGVFAAAAGTVALRLLDSTQAKIDTLVQRGANGLKAAATTVVATGAATGAIGPAILFAGDRFATTHAAGAGVAFGICVLVLGVRAALSASWRVRT